KDQLVRARVGGAARDIIFRTCPTIGIEQSMDGIGRAAEKRSEIDRAALGDRSPSGCAAMLEFGDLHAAAAVSSPARSSTASSFCSSSGVAGAIGRRCSFCGIRPSRFIIYFIG